MQIAIRRNGVTAAFRVEIAAGIAMPWNEIGEEAGPDAGRHEVTLDGPSSSVAVRTNL
jgi:hypothetical protein